MVIRQILLLRKVYPKQKHFFECTLIYPKILNLPVRRALVDYIDFQMILPPLFIIYFKNLSKFVQDISGGLKDAQMARIKYKSIELKMLLNRLICVDPNKRLEVDQVLVDPWTTEHGNCPVQPHTEIRICREEVNSLIKTCQDKLQLHHVPVSKILEHIR